MNTEERTSLSGRRAGPERGSGRDRRPQAREQRAEVWRVGVGQWAWLTVIHQRQGDLVFGFSILELGGVRPFVILRQVLDDHFHQALLSDKIDFAVLGRINPENLFCPFPVPGDLCCGAQIRVYLDLGGGMCGATSLLRPGQGPGNNCGA